MDWFRYKAIAVVAGCAALVGTTFPTPVGGQIRERPIRLEEAVSIAVRHGSEARIAAAYAEAARQGAREASAVLYPWVSVESGVLRSNDPVAAFGTKLRQTRFGEPDFTIPSLNNPDPITDWTGGVRLSWRGLDPRVWALRDASAREADAAGSAEARTREAVVFETTRAYYGAVRGRAQLDAADALVESARSTRDRFQRRMEQGLLTEADLLQVRAELASAEAARLGARQAANDARRRLGIVLGWAADSIPVPSSPMAPAGPEPPGGSSNDRVGDRADLEALRFRLSAAEARVSGSAAAWFPRLEAFGGYTTHARDPFASDGTDWSVGLGLRWDVFAGFRRPAGIARTRAAAEAVRAGLERAERTAEAEARGAREGVETAWSAASASRAAVNAAVAGRDLMRRRFEEGLASPSDLLQAEARAADMNRRAIDALADYHVAVARLRFALGAPVRDARVHEGGDR